MLLRQIFDPKLAQYAYLIGCQRTGEALIIDPERDIDRYLEIAREEGLRLTAVADEKNHRWDPLNNGALVKGTGCFNGAMLLTNGDEEFEVEEVWEDTTNATYRMKGTLSGMKVERRIMVDREIGAARYLDIFHNTTDEDLDMVFTYKIWMSFEAEKIYTSRGRELTANLGTREV